jgi:3-oxoadipate enol-lactonase
MPEITTNDGVCLHYSEAGKGDPVVLIHGLGFSGAAWAPIVNQLTNKHRVITIDNRCVGMTRAPDGPFSISDMADDVVDLLVQVVNAPAHIVGFSMGGMIAQHLAGKHHRHVRSLALLSTTVRPDARTAALAGLWRDMALGGAQQELLLLDQLLWCSQASFFDNPSAVQQTVAQLMAQPAPQSPNDFVRQITACMEHDATLTVSSIRNPTIVLVGPEERFFSIKEAQQLADMIPEARCKVLSAGAHNAWLEYPSEVAAELSGFFERA